MFATIIDYKEKSIPLSVFDYKLDKFNDRHFEKYNKYRKSNSKNNELSKALSYVNYVEANNGNCASKIVLSIELTPLFHLLDVNEKR